MARDDLPSFAVGEAPPVFAIEGTEPRNQAIRRRGRAERRGDLPRDGGVANRVEPDVGIESLPVPGPQQIDAVEHVDGWPLPALDRMLHRWLEAVPGEHGEPGVTHAPDLTGRQLEVVRLRPRRGQVHDLGAGPATCPAAYASG